MASSLASQLSPGVSVERRPSRAAQPSSRSGTPTLTGGPFGAIGGHRGSGAASPSPQASLDSVFSSGGSQSGDGAARRLDRAASPYHSASLRSPSPSFVSASSHLQMPSSEEASEPASMPALLVEDRSPDIDQTPRADLADASQRPAMRNIPSAAALAASTAEETDDDADHRGASMVGQLVDGDEDEAEEELRMTTRVSSNIADSSEVTANPRVMNASSSSGSLSGGAAPHPSARNRESSVGTPVSPAGYGSVNGQQPGNASSGSSGSLNTDSYPFPAARSVHSPSLASSGAFLSLPAANSSAQPQGGAPLTSLTIPHNIGATGSSTSVAATLGGPPSNPAFSPFGSPPHDRPNSSSSIQSLPFASHQSLGHAAAATATPVTDAHTATFDGNRGGVIGTPNNANDALLRSSPLFTEVLDRIIRLEGGLKDVTRTLSGLSRNVSLLLDRTRHMHQPQPQGYGQQSYPPPRGQAHSPLPFGDAKSAAVGTGQAQDEVRSLSMQMSALTGSVAQLLAIQQGQQSAGSQGAPSQHAPPTQGLAGLGLGPGSTPQLGGNISTPQLGTMPGTPHLSGPAHGRPNSMHPYERSVSPRVGGPGPPHGIHPGHASQVMSGSESRLSPRPGGGAGSNPNRTSWGAGPPGSQGSQGGYQAPGQKDSLGPNDPRRWSGVGQGAFSPALNPNIRRESMGTPALGAARNGTPDIESTGRFGGPGAHVGSLNGPAANAGSALSMAPPDANVVVTKWEHLNLHMDLLRCILKYGLGPPNKIQQRALPFLLRGSDIIAQAPPTQERIASYVIPALQLILNVLRGEPQIANNNTRGPIAVIISTTVDQATQAQRMALGLGAALGLRVHIAAGGGMEPTQEANNIVSGRPHLIVGTPQKMNEVFHHLSLRGSNVITLADIRLVVLDEVDQLIARNLADYVSTLLRALPPARGGAPRSASGDDLARSPLVSPGLPASSGPGHPYTSSENSLNTVERQTAIFSNTVPQDVLNFAQSIHLRESVRVLVRREGSGGALLATTTYGNPGSGWNAVASGAVSSPSVGSGTMGLGNNHGNAPTYQSPNPQGQSGFPPLQMHSQQQQAHNFASAHSQPQHYAHAVGAPPAQNSAMTDSIMAALRGLRQYYVYVAMTEGSSGKATPSLGQGSFNQHGMEMKLDVITDLLEDIDFGQAVVYTSSSANLEAVTYKLASKGIEALALSKEMAPSTRSGVLAKFRGGSTTGNAYQAASHAVVGGPGSGGNVAGRKCLVVHDLAVNPRDVHQVPLVVFYDLPRSVEEYKEKISCAASAGASAGLGRPSVCINVVTGSGGSRGDVETLRSLELALGCKMAELPMHLGQILNF
ncbi:translation initiation factor [Ceraceosorus bombacis]|uniref:RNA helicase n=1 Tax=Ceraceosorus bombacis TaxID=401625 RepID=A0A0P1BMY1_9BASI|nr:translation initiation factor [Ceraceosorus bombacis]